MTLVVSDTSPLTNLAAIGRFSLLQSLYGEVHIAEAVWQELNAQDHRWPGRNEVETASWISRHSAQNRWGKLAGSSAPPLARVSVGNFIGHHGQTSWMCPILGQL